MANTRTDQPPPPAQPGGSAPSPEEEVPWKEKLGRAGTTAKRTWRVARALVRPLLPKRWTPRNIAITVTVVIVLLLLIKWAIDTFLNLFMWFIIIALVGAGLYLLFGPRR